MFDPSQLLNALLGGGNAKVGAQAQAGVPAQGGLGGILGGLLAQVEQNGGAAGIATKIFGQASSGLHDAAGKLEGATGLGAQAEAALKGVTGGEGFGDLISKAQAMMGQNQLASGAALGGLASLLLGTSTGRGAAVDAAKLGGLAMIGGLAYKAYQNFTSASLIPATREATVAAPAASPFGTTANSVTDSQTALVLVRTMIAAAGSDGLMSTEERSSIVGGLSQVGLDTHASAFLDAEFAKPATVETLVAACNSPEMAAQIYTAARLAVHADRPGEILFLKKLAAGLVLDPNLVAHIEATAHTVKGH